LRVKLTNHAREKDHSQPRTQEHVGKRGTPERVSASVGPPEMLAVKTITTTMN
jgi:hypothetical protein